MSRNNIKKQKLNPVRIEIKPSKFLKREVGVFAAKNLPKDSVVIDADHFSDIRFIPWGAFKSYDKVTKAKVMGFCPATPEGFYAPKDLNYMSIAWHMNHTCNPNIGFNNKDDFVAMRNIKKGEELSWDYGFDETNPKFKMKCFCGRKECRKFVTGNDWIILMKDKTKYKYFSPKLKEFINKQNKK